MYQEQFNALGLRVVQLPVEFSDQGAIYRGYIRELPFLAGEGQSLQEVYRQLLEAYQVYGQEQIAAQQQEETPEMTSTLLSYEDLLKYYDGETFDGFEISSEDK